MQKYNSYALVAAVSPSKLKIFFGPFASGNPQGF